MSLTGNILKSALFASSAKFIGRLFGFISTLLLARILTPEDFAYIAVISICLYFFDVLSHVGGEQYIVQKKNISGNDLNTAWTLDIILKTAVYFIIVFFSDSITFFLGSPELSTALKVASIVLIINAFKNPLIILQKRDLNYKTFFKLSLIQRFVSFIVIIFFAIQLKSYWAFIIADIFAATVFTLSSYLLIKGRGKFCLVNSYKQWLFSKWLLGKNILGYLRSQLDTILVAKYFNISTLGHYHMARDIAMLPGHNIFSPAIEPLLAAFRHFKDDPLQLSEKFYSTLFITAILAVPISTYIIFYAELTVEVLLGNQWVFAGELLKILTGLFLYWVFLLVIENALLALGKVKLIFFMDLLFLIFSLIFLYLLLSINTDIKLFAYLRVFIGFVSIFILFVVSCLHIPFRFVDTIILCCLPLLISLTSIFLTERLIETLSINSVLLFLLSGGLFIGCYLLILFAITYIFKRTRLFNFLWMQTLKLKRNNS